MIKTSLTEEEIEERTEIVIDFAMEAAEKTGAVTMQHIVALLKRYEVNNVPGIRNTVIDTLKGEKIRIGDATYKGYAR